MGKPASNQMPFYSVSAAWGQKSGHGFCIHDRHYRTSLTKGYASSFVSMTETTRRSPRVLLKQTTPSTKANNVWSFPMPMFVPGKNSVPL